MNGIDTPANVGVAAAVTMVVAITLAIVIAEVLWRRDERRQAREARAAANDEWRSDWLVGDPVVEAALLATTFETRAFASMVTA